MTIEIDGAIFADAEYQMGNELIVFFRNGSGYLLIYDVSEKEFLALQNDPTDEAVLKLYKSQGGKVFRRK